MTDERTAQDQTDDEAVREADAPSDETPSPEDSPTAAGAEDSPGDEDSPLDLIDPTDGTAAGGTALADATHGADAVDEALGDDAPLRPERGEDLPLEDEDEEAEDAARVRQINEIERFGRAVSRAYGPRPTADDDNDNGEDAT